MKTIRWGMIGCGNVTEVKSGPALQKASNSALVAVMGRNGERARDYAQRHGVAKWYDNAAALINDTGVDAVYIATPPDSHLDYTVAVARAGKPVYVEKPMARTHAECQAMIAACAAAGVPLWVAYYRRSLPKFRKVQELVESGIIGRVRTVHVVLHRKAREQAAGQLPWRVLPEIAGGGHFVDLAAHTLDYLDYLLGPIVQAQGDATNQAKLYPAEDTVTGSFTFASGVLGTGNWCFCSYTRMDQVELIGERGKISFATFENDEPIVVTSEAGRAEYQLAPPVHIQQPLIQSIVDELNGSGTCPSTGTSAARTSWVMDQLLAGWRGRQ